MPPKNCSACNKLVFPMEELKCLDKTWHKACFKCQVCNMTLNMKNYKGYDRMPYCVAHYPETKFTAVADTPEARRLAQNSKIQSQVAYHSEFEENKGQYTFIPDNPEIQRHKKNTEIISSVKYHEDFEKQKGAYTAVADDPETLRVKKNMQTISNASYHGELMRKQSMDNYRPNEYEPEETSAPEFRPPQPAPPSQQNYRPAQAAPEPQPPQQQPYRRQPGSISEYDPMQNNASPYSAKTQSTTVYSSQPVSQPPPQPVAATQPKAPRDPYAGKGRVSKALYDYSAADADEVGFQEDDLIIYCEPIDEGWMTGTVERTGGQGMLPANYVERLNW